MVKFTHSRPDALGPSSSLGIMRYFEDTGAPKISPEFVIGICVVLIVIMLAIQLL